MREKKNYQPKSKIAHWLDARLPIIRWVYEHILNFQVPRNLNYFYSFGGILTLMLLSQILTGLVMAMHYVPDSMLAFASRERFIRDGQFGWLFGPWHQVGASFFFIAAYIHMARGLYYGSYKGGRELVWIIGLLLYLTMMAIAFFGYVLVWGMMSTTAATVISSFLKEFPFIGDWLYQLFLGDYSVGQPALNRFYVFHYVLTFFLVFLVFLHIWAVHKVGSTNPAGVAVKTEKDVMPFSPFALIKDIFACCIFLIFFAWFLFYMPDYMGQADNYIEGDIMKTPIHITPEWYFLPFYAILRGINFSIGPFSASTLGAFFSLSTIFILFLVPWLDRSSAPNACFRPLYKIFLRLLWIDFVFLGWLGSRPIEPDVIFWTKIALSYYFIFFLIILPFLPIFEKIKKQPESIYLDYKKSQS